MLSRETHTLACRAVRNNAVTIVEMMPHQLIGKLAAAQEKIEHYRQEIALTQRDLRKDIQDSWSVISKHS